ncbi:MAG: hypothetical protein P4L03_01005 [Terracidiphilus sp.]|nr:hypothetical protein [Terracidiphilus sp.]
MLTPFFFLDTINLNFEVCGLADPRAPVSRGAHFIFHFSLLLA